MNLDFHYFGTLLAALTAGYDKEEAKKIARAAQFVDDCTVHQLHSKVDYEQIATSRATQDIVADGLDWKPYNAEDVKRAREIWSYFHFLPGNENLQIPFHGKRKNGPLETTKWSIRTNTLQTGRLERRRTGISPVLYCGSVSPQFYEKQRNSRTFMS